MNSFWENNISVKDNLTYLKCQSCKKEYRIYFPEKAELFLCPDCNCIHSKENSEYNKIAKNKKQKFVPSIPYGSVATIEDKKYTLISISYKHEKSDRRAKWEEYTLVDEKGNYFFLSQSFGHWLLLWEIDPPKDFNKAVKGFTREDTLHYDFLSSYYQLTINGIGEFHEDVIASKSKFTREYIAPPKIFAYEENGPEKTFYEGEYLKPSEVADLFPETSLALPMREGVGSCQPFYFGINHLRFFRLSIIYIIALLGVILMILPFHSGSKGALTEVNAHLTDSIRHVNIVSNTFRLEGSLPKLIQFQSYANVDNDWIENEITLVNENTGEEKSFTDGIEYYHGYDDGEAWSEGEARKLHYISHVEPGTYHIEANIIGSESRRYTDYRLSAYSDYPTMFNYLLLGGSLFIISIILYYSGNKFENVRRGITDNE